jgi:hypothetical protein
MSSRQSTAQNDQTRVGGGTLAIYLRYPRQATVPDIEFAGLITQTAVILIDCHTQAKQRHSAEEASRIWSKDRTERIK